MAGFLRAPHNRLGLLGPSFLWLSATLVLTTAVPAADVIYRYTDEHGVLSYTDTWEHIPERARSQALALDGDTLEPVRPGAQAPPPAASGSVPRAAALPTSQTGQHLPSLFAAWADRFSHLTIPLPSQYELGVGLTALVLMIWGIIIIRMTANVLVKLLVKLGLVLVAGGAVYALYFSGSNDRITEATGEPVNPSITGKELIGDVRTATGTAADKLTHATVDRLKEAVHQAEDVTLGEATRTVEQANETNRRLTEQLDRIEPPRPDAAPAAP